MSCVKKVRAYMLEADAAEEAGEVPHVRRFGHQELWLASVG